MCIPQGTSLWLIHLNKCTFSTTLSLRVYTYVLWDIITYDFLKVYTQKCEVIWYLLVVLLCTYLIMSNVEHLFICLLAILWPIFWLDHLFSWNWATWAAYIFLRLIFCVFLHLLLFSPILKVVFSPLLIVSFIVQKLLSLIKSYLFTFDFISITLEGGS